MRPELKDFIERHIQLIEDKNFEDLYIEAYMEYMNDSDLVPSDVNSLTDVLTEVFGEEPILSNQLEYVPNYYRVTNDKIIDVVIPEGITSIGYSAYRNCKNIETLKLPKTLQEISESAFKGCDKLGSITYAGTKVEWDNIILGIQAFASSGWFHEDKIVYCKDGVIKI